MSVNANPEEVEAESPAPEASPPPEGVKKNEYLVHTNVRTMLGNPSALYHGKVVVIRSDIRKHIMRERHKRKEEKKRRKAEIRRLKQEKKRAWEEQKLKKMLEEDGQRPVSLPLSPPPEEATGVTPEAIYCNTCGTLSYESRVEYQYSVSSHLTAVFLTLCCYCWLPYLLRCCMDEAYYCHNCGAFLGKTSTLSRRKIR